MQIQVGKPFGPVAASTVLDGSGNGTVTFQANGATARISNLFVRVSTTTAQAVALIYRGQIADVNLINQTNSGSTGAAATGVIDVTDGVTLYVVWTGGDPGATATATFVGDGIPFSEAHTATQLVWDNPIAAGDGSLIYPALKSPNFVTNVSGWRISRDGDAEFNSVIVRGQLYIQSTSGAYVHAFADSTNAEIDFQPPDLAGHTFLPGRMLTANDSGGPAGVLEILSPTMDGFGNSAELDLLSYQDGTTLADLTADQVFIVSISRPVSIFSNGTDMQQWDGGSVVCALVAGDGSRVFNNAITFNYPYSVAPSVVLTINSPSGSLGRWTCRVFSITTTTAGIILEKGALADGNIGANTNVTVNWIAMGV